MGNAGLYHRVSSNATHTSQNDVEIIDHFACRGGNVIAGKMAAEWETA
jgi:hypothetical protein